MTTIYSSSSSSASSPPPPPLLLFDLRKEQPQQASDPVALTPKAKVKQPPLDKNTLCNLGLLRS